MSKNMLGVTIRESREPLKTLLDRLSGKNSLYWSSALDMFLDREDPFASSSNLSSNGISPEPAHASLKELIVNLDGTHGYYWLSALKKFLRKEKPFKVMTGAPTDEVDQLPLWQSFFDTIGIDCNVFVVKIPRIQSIMRLDLRQIIIVPEGLTLDWLLEIMESKFDVRLYINDHDMLCLNNDRSNTVASYVVWARDRIEADKEHSSRSANEMLDHGVSGITLMERLLFELKYYMETNEHLDMINTATLCAGSRVPKGDMCGYIPYVRWDNSYQHLVICRAAPDSTRCDHRVREVIT